MLRILAGGRLPPLRNQNKNRVLSFSHYNKMNLVNGYISRLQGFCLFRIIYKPRERILSAHGVMLCKILILYRFFHAKTSRFPRRFPYRSRRGGNLPPAKNAKRFSLYIRLQSRLRRDYNPHVVRKC